MADADAPSDADVPETEASGKEASTDATKAPGDSDETPDGRSRESNAGVVAGGIMASRVAGLVRERVIAFFFGVGAHADVLQFAFRAPNLLQNLLGEGTISAAFIPIYSRLIEEDRPRAAGRFAGAIFGLLTAVAAGAALLGVLAAEPIVSVLAAGFGGGETAGGVDRFGLAVQAVRIMFPMAALLVLAAWTLGVLNSHRRFFLPYVAPVLWNVAIIAGLVGTAVWWTGSPAGLTPEAWALGRLDRLLFAGCFGALAGGALQFLVQLPLVVRVLPHFEWSLSTRVEGVQQALRQFGPIVAGRGVAQLSGYLDMLLASFLAVGALSSLRFALILYMLPVSLFGMSVAAAELPELSRLTAEQARAFTQRLRRSLRQILFLTVPTAIGYLAFGWLLVGALFRTGSFGPASQWLVYVVLGGYSLGLLATTLSRLLQNAFYAVDDAKTPAKVAALRVTVSTALAVPLMLGLDRVAVAEVVALPPGAEALYLGALGLSLGASGGAWVELARLRTVLRRRLPDEAVTLALPWGRTGRMAGLALAAAGPAGALWAGLQGAAPALHVILQAAAVVGLYAASYLGGAYALGWPEMNAWVDRFRREGA